MTNVRKTWKTLGAVPDPFEPGVVYVTQELTGHEVTYVGTNGDVKTIWLALSESTGIRDINHTPVDEHLPSKPETRVQRCRLHANGRLENTDVAPKDINDTHKIQVVLGDGSGLWNHLSEGMEPGDELVFKNIDGKVDKVFKPTTVSSLSLPGSGYHPDYGYGTEEPKKPELYFPQDVSFGEYAVAELISSWVGKEGTHIAVLGKENVRSIRNQFDKDLGGLSDYKRFGYTEWYWKAAGTHTLVLPGEDGKKSSQVHFYGYEDRDRMRGMQFHYAVVEQGALDGDRYERTKWLAQTGNKDLSENAVTELFLATRLGDHPTIVILDDK
jgi:hypothetical protein